MATGLGWLTRRSRTRGDHVEDRTLTRQNVPPALLQDVPGGVTVNPRTALQIADAYACIRALSDAAASLPLIAYRRTPTGRQRLENRTADLLAHPAPATTQASLIGQIVAHLNLHGNSFVGKFRDGAGNIDQLALLHPDRVTVELRGGRPVFTVAGPKGESSAHTTDDIVHVKGMSTDGLVGLSPVKQCATALGLSANLTEHAARFFENDARPSGILQIDGGGTVVSGDLMREIGEKWTNAHAGVKNAHRMAIVVGQLDFKPVSMPMEDAQFLQQRELSAQEVARIFRVPPWIVGAKDGGSMTYSNTEQQALHFVSYSLRPWLVAIEQAFSADRDLFMERTYCEFLLDALLRADSATRAQVYTAALNPETGWMTRQEVRRLENLEPESESPSV